MITLLLKGGLGNQMFQYAAAKTLAYKLNTKLILDVSALSKKLKQDVSPNIRAYELNIFEGVRERKINKNRSIATKLINKLSSKFLKQNVFNEPAFTYCNDFWNISPPVILNGYWQSEKYFDSYSTAIREAFTFPVIDEDDKNFPIFAQIKNQTSVAVHIRRGDYLLQKNLAFHGICSLDYYEKSISFLKKQYPHACFFFFSDDTDWVKKELVHMIDKYAIVEGNNNQDAWKDMFLMSCCDHNIIANSSFSWWAAWLNKNPAKTVIAPEQWFQTSDAYYSTADLIPGSWIRV